MAMTKNGIFNNINDSTYKIILNYSDKQITYYFTSMVYMKKFKESLEMKYKEWNDRLSRYVSFNFDYSLHFFSDMQNYITIEKRGFLIEFNGVKLNSLKDIKFSCDLMLDM